jgi:hypothetical protein
MMLSVQSGNKTPKHAMENISITETKKEGTQRAQVKRTLICFFFYHKGIVHFKFLEQG